MKGYLICMCDYILLEVLDVEILPINVVRQSVFHIAVSRNKFMLLLLDPQFPESQLWLDGRLYHDALYGRFGDECLGNCR